MSARRPHGLAGAKRIVIKIGSVLLVEQATGTIHRTWLNALADDIAGLVRGGSEIVLVSSGAIAVGAVGLASYLGRFLPAAGDTTPWFQLPLGLVTFSVSPFRATSMDWRAMAIRAWFRMSCWLLR